MKRSAWIALACVVWTPWSVAGLFDEVKPHATNYEYFQAGFVSQPNDFDGMEVGASLPFASNVAFIGRLAVPTASIDGNTVEARRIEVGTRYFFEMPNLDDTDADIGVSLANTGLSGGGFDDSESGVLLAGQLRRALDRQIGKSPFAVSETYGGAQIWMGDDQATRSVHAGLLVDLNETVSANAELLYDEGAQVRIGIRMDIAKPGAPRRAALITRDDQLDSEDGALVTAALESAPTEAPENSFVAFVRNLFQQGPDEAEAPVQLDTEDTVSIEEVAVIEEVDAAVVEDAKPATGALSVFGVGEEFNLDP